MSVLLNAVWVAFIVSGLLIVFMRPPTVEQDGWGPVSFYIVLLLLAVIGIWVGTYQLIGS